MDNNTVVTMGEENTIDELALAFIEAQRATKAAKEKQDAIQAQLLEAVGAAKTIETPNFKVTKSTPQVMEVTPSGMDMLVDMAKHNFDADYWNPNLACLKASKEFMANPEWYAMKERASSVKVTEK